MPEFSRITKSAAKNTTFIHALAASIGEDDTLVRKQIKTTMQSFYEKSDTDASEKEVIQIMLSDAEYFDGVDCKQIEYWQRATGRAIFFISNNQQLTCPYKDLEYSDFRPTGKPVFIYLYDDNSYTGCHLNHSFSPDVELVTIQESGLFQSSLNLCANEESSGEGGAKAAETPYFKPVVPAPVIAPECQPKTKSSGLEGLLGNIFQLLLSQSFKNIAELNVDNHSLRHFAFLVAPDNRVLDQKRRAHITALQVKAKKTAYIVAEGMATTEPMQSTAPPTSGNKHSHHAEAQCLATLTRMLNNGALKKEACNLYLFIIAVNKKSRAHCADPCQDCVRRIMNVQQKDRIPYNIPFIVTSQKTEPGQVGNFRIIDVDELEPEDAHQCYSMR
jgi:hypothetical protein